MEAEGVSEPTEAELAEAAPPEPRVEETTLPETGVPLEEPRKLTPETYLARFFTEWGVRAYEAEMQLASGAKPFEEPPPTPIPAQETPEAGHGLAAPKEEIPSFAAFLRDQEAQAGVAAGPPRHEGSEQELAIATPTLAELYAKQGHFNKAIKIYLKLLDDDPTNETFHRRIEELLEWMNKEG